jgi:hypothetical protein
MGKLVGRDGDDRRPANFDCHGYGILDGSRKRNDWLVLILAVPLFQA